MHNTCNVEKDLFLYHIFSSKARCTFKTLYRLMDSFFWLDTIHMEIGMVNCVYQGVTGYNFPNENCISFSLTSFLSKQIV